jgi:ABC-type uncharacterized transport system involved in gliding motility auxiliary subunit
MAGWGRRLLTSGNLLVTLVLIGFLFIMVNYLASRRYARWDLTRQQLTKLSDQTVQTLTSLEQPVTVTVFYQPSHRLYGMVRDLLTEYARVSPKVRVEYVDPEQDIARAQRLVQQFQIESPNVVVFQMETRHKYLSDTDLAEYDYSTMTARGEPFVKSFKGEDAFTSTILSVSRATAPLIWFAAGHGEKSIDAADRMGLSAVKGLLERQNMSVQSVNLLEKASTIPSDVKAVVLAGPTHRLTESEVASLQAYLDQGGRLLALLDPLTDTGLEPLLERWGIRLGNDIVVDPSRQLPFVSAANLFATTYTEHPIVGKMKTLMTLFPLTRSVQPVDPAPTGFKVTRLVLTSENGWGETQTGVETFEFNEGQDARGPVPIAAASEHAADSGVIGAKGRLVVVGDSEFLVDGQLGNVGNQDFFLGIIYWLIEQEQLIGIGPKVIQSIKLNLTGAQLKNLFWFSFLGLPLLCGAAGAGVWWRRRR